MGHTVPTHALLGPHTRILPFLFLLLSLRLLLCAGPSCSSSFFHSSHWPSLCLPERAVRVRLAFPSLSSRCRPKELRRGISGTASTMFHTFQSSVGLRSPGGESDGSSNKPTRAAGSRRISTSNACVECRRRKIRCDGSQPCGQCQWYQHPEACGYSKPAQRVVPSRK